MPVDGKAVKHIVRPHRNLGRRNAEIFLLRLRCSSHIHNHFISVRRKAFCAELERNHTMAVAFLLINVLHVGNIRRALNADTHFAACRARQPLHINICPGCSQRQDILCRCRQVVRSVRSGQDAYSRSRRRPCRNCQSKKRHPYTNPIQNPFPHRFMYPRFRAYFSINIIPHFQRSGKYCF